MQFRGNTAVPGPYHGLQGHMLHHVHDIKVSMRP